jgi:hypothetical protein
MRFRRASSHDGRAAFGAAILLCLLASTPAWGEPTSESIRMAKKRFAEGVAAADAGNYEAARVAFQQAYALKPHPSVLHNLGQSELKTGHYLEAARHLATFLRDTSFGAPSERELAKKALSQAEAKLSKLVVEVDIDGAEITVDGVPAGRSPMGPDPAYVEPGDRVVRVQKEAYPTFEQHQMFEAGRTAQLKVALRAGEALPTPAASVSRVNTSDVVSPWSDTAPGDLGPPPRGLAPAPDPGGSSERTIVLVSGAGLTTVALALGVVFTLRGSAANGDASDQKASIDAMGGPNACSGPGASSPGCTHLADTLDTRNRANSVAKVSFVAAGVLGAATVVTYFLWPRRSGTELSLAPQVAPGALGLWATGTF